MCVPQQLNTKMTGAGLELLRSARSKCDIVEDYVVGHQVNMVLTCSSTCHHACHGVISE